MSCNPAADQVEQTLKLEEVRSLHQLEQLFSRLLTEVLVFLVHESEEPVLLERHFDFGFRDSFQDVAVGYNLFKHLHFDVAEVNLVVRLDVFVLHHLIYQRDLH